MEQSIKKVVLIKGPNGKAEEKYWVERVNDKYICPQCEDSEDILVFGIPGEIGLLWCLCGKRWIPDMAIREEKSAFCMGS